MLHPKRPETLTQAYHAGVIIAMVENYLPKEYIPPIGVCIANFHALRELLGERLWQKLKHRQKFVKRISLYEALTYQPFLSRHMIGTSRDFCLGYVRAYQHSRLKRNTDRERSQAIPSIYNYLVSKGRFE